MNATKNISFCNNFSISSEKNECYSRFTPKNASIQFCKSKDNKDFREWCLAKNAVHWNNISLCNNITKQDYKESCYARFLKRPLELEKCHQIKHESTKNMCLRKFAIRNKNITACESIGGTFERELCIRKIAMNTGNKQRCSRLHGVIKDICNLHFILKENNEELCEDLDNDYLQHSCVINIAIKNRDDSICLDLPKGERGVCLTNYALSQNKKLSYCNGINDNKTRQECIKTVSNFEPNIVANITKEHCSLGKGEYYNPCLYNLARETLNWDICLLINDSKERKYCFQKALLEGKGINFCERIRNYSEYSEFSSQKECLAYALYRNAIKENNISLCEEIPASDPYKNYCYEKLAFRHLNSSYCKYINDSYMEDECYSSICISNESLSDCEKVEFNKYRAWSKAILAVNTDNISLCNNILDDHYARICEEKIRA